MKKLITTAALFLALAFNVKANDLPRKEYPRPQFEREDWINLNGPSILISDSLVLIVSFRIRKNSVRTL
mgnify:CR=1 FL=1